MGCGSSGEPVSLSHELPAHDEHFPDLESRESAAAAPESLGFSGLASAQEPSSLQKTLYFPYRSGNVTRDQFAQDYPHHHSVCWGGDYSRALGRGLRNLRDSAGSWRLRRGGGEPETEAFGGKTCRVARSSLWPSSAVRFRPSRFCGTQNQQPGAETLDRSGARGRAPIAQQQSRLACVGLSRERQQIVQPCSRVPCGTRIPGQLSGSTSSTQRQSVSR